MNSSKAYGGIGNITALPAQHAQQSLQNGTVSVRLSTRRLQQHAARLQLWARPAEDTDQLLQQQAVPRCQLL